MTQTRKAIGMMSGTSMDGIDVALIETDGEDVVQRGPSATYPYDRDVRRRIGAAMADARVLTLATRDHRPGCLAAVEDELTVLHADALAAFLSNIGIDRREIDIVGFHGQTVIHKPRDGLTVQIGDGDRLCELTGLTVAWDMRANDMANEGEGAPLAPVYHRAMVAQLAERPVAVLNIGGVANVTWIGPDGALSAFDTGPGNALIDDWMAKRTGTARDQDGNAARQGTVQDGPVKFFLGHAYFDRTPPKSLDRNTFFWDLVEGLSVEDGAATLTAMTVGAIAKARQHMFRAPKQWLVCGGGRHNATLMAMLREKLAVPVRAVEDLGFDGDSVEAEAWAYLAVRAQRQLPLSFPGTTGVEAPLSGGRISLQ